MPIVNRKSTLLPANARAADVASRMVETIMPIQQQRVAAAFRVQGIEAVLYNQLTSGTPCTCRSGDRQLSILSPDGKAPEGIINRMMTGQEFDVTPYTSKPQKLFQEDGFYIEPSSEFKRVGEELGTANILTDGPAVGDNGAYDPENLDDIVNLFDASDVGFADVSCPVCFGTSFVGGYTPYRSWRRVVTPTEMKCNETIDYQSTPWELNPCAFSFDVVLPKGALAVDSFRVFHKTKVVTSNPTIDGHAITSAVEVLAYCDGKSHTIGFSTEDPVTHVELQFALSSESAFFEIPRLSKSGDRSFLERTEPFQVTMSPDVPQISSMDVIVESQMGKALLVGGITPWQTRNRSNLGWEFQVRVTQPQELYRLLPTRGKIYGARTTNKVLKTKPNRSGGV